MAEVAAPAADESSIRRLIELLTGAWVSQALYTFAKLGIADLIDAGHSEMEALACTLKCQSDRLIRLLRLLEAHDVVAIRNSTVSLTRVGNLLRRKDTRSHHALAELYGEVYFEAYAHLGAALNHHQNAFQASYGQRFFDHLETRPGRRELFNRAMASLELVLEEVPLALSLADDARVLDVGGGRGTLMMHMLNRSPGVRGMIVDQPDTIRAADILLRRSGHRDRCDLQALDFFEDPLPAGYDCYVLSRILHDWDDEQCQIILQSVREAMPSHATLAIIERPIGEGDSKLALLYDLHMMAMFEGQERTTQEYETLLKGAGLHLDASFPLALDMRVLIARKP